MWLAEMRRMTRLTLHGATMYAEGSLPKPGQDAPRFSLATESLSDVGLDHFGPRCKLLNIVPSLELPSCAAAAQRLAELLRPWPDAVLITISPDLPFAGARFGLRDAEGRVLRLSSFRSPGFARAYGVELVSGPLKGLLAPALLVLDARHRVLHAQLVREMSDAPDHAAALDAVRRACSRDAATSVASTPVATVAA
jgi:thiol peroxidase